MSHGRAQGAAGELDRPAPNYGPSRKCRYCGCSLAGLDHRAEFCSKDHRNLWWRRARLRGGAVYQKLIDWRTSRGTKKGVLGDIAFIVDQWIQEDKK